MAWLTILALGIVVPSLAYLYVLALAGTRVPPVRLPPAPRHRIAVAVPAYNEEASIGDTVRQLMRQAYPRDLFTIFVVADNCSDRTAAEARDAGAVCLERHCPERGKGHALQALFAHVLAQRPSYDAVVVFDADSAVDPQFLRVMDAMLTQGNQVAQGKHVVANPTQGWMPAMMYTSFAMDNRLRNLGRSNLGLSAKLMGDGMCFARPVLEAHQWNATSETEDAEYWATLVRAGVRVAFAPAAITSGEIPTSYAAAGRQRARWMRGRAQLTRGHALRLARTGMRQLSWGQLDAAVEVLMPSYSTLVLLAVAASAAAMASARGWACLMLLWASVLAYPLLALTLERSPLPVYVYLLSAPVYVAYRTLVRLWVAVRRRPTPWVRTPRRNEQATR